ncbi:von Willebrand factor type A [Arcobacter nitrofigilis DSM 7299]|uniref:von Willebrand factor type A n=1 Tax=Arcobacter nitrofigilis (strain ATCC 33309 / DSM 7299 / CCUG 15893 / LMG 7604 / NCTC 12251 / CI) TaxID=572480 RepID=D5V6A7_ARCNC|nr:immunoglobulin-like domain-containing protein [Arcobacter nitrofigilis]ADG94177.1 von Willebrand factor type A [Arcobacter nitrofigilis DSM 7299]
MNLIIKEPNGSYREIEVNKNTTFSPKEGEQYFLDNSKNPGYSLNLIDGQSSIQLIIGTNPKLKLTFDGMADLIKSNGEENKTVLSVIYDKEGMTDLKDTVLNPDFKSDDIIRDLQARLDENLTSSDKPNGVIIDDFGSLTSAMEAASAGEQVVSDSSTTPTSINNDIDLNLNPDNRPDGFRTTRSVGTIGNNNGTNNDVTTDTTEGTDTTFTGYTFNYAENTAAGTTLGSVAATDPEGDDVTYSIKTNVTNADGEALYQIDANTGAISLTAAGVASFADDYEQGTNAQDIVVTATDSENNTTDINVNLNETDVNEAPEFTPPTGETEYTFNYAENTAAGTTLGSVAATDPEGDDVTYSIKTNVTNADGEALYQIDANTGAISLTAAGVASFADDYEQGTNAQDIVVTATDSENNTTDINVNLNETDVNEAPEFTPPTGETEYTFNYAENTAAGTTLGSVAATDPEGDDVTYSIKTNVTNADGEALYQIDANTGAISLTAAGVASFADDYEQGTNAQDIVVTATDSENNTTDINVNLNETDVNEAPEFTPPTGETEYTFNYAENTAAGTTLGSVAATDPEGDDVTYSIKTNVTNADGEALYQIDANTGAISLTAAGVASFADDYEQGTNAQDIVVTATDSENNTTDINVNLNETDVNEAPEFTPPTGETEYTFNYAENTAAGTTLGSVAATDPEGDDVTYSIKTNVTNADGEALYQIDANTGAISLTAAGVASFADDYEQGTNAQDIVVTATDSENNTTDINVNLNETDVNEAPEFTPPTGETEYTFNYAENTAAGTTLGSVAATDPEGDDVTYSIKTNVTNADGEALYQIDANTGAISLTAAGVASFADDYEQGTNAQDIVVTATDSENNTTDINVNLNETDVNEAPEFTPPTGETEYTFNYAENTAAGTTLGSVAATDPEGDDVTYSIKTNVTNADGEALYQIDANTGAISLTAAGVASFADDYEQGTNAQDIVVTATDSENNTTDINVNLNETDVNEAPIFAQVRLSATDTNEAAETVTFTATLSYKAGSDVTVHTTLGDILIKEGQTTGKLEVTNPNTEDVYKDASTLDNAITSVEGGDFGKITPNTDTVSAHIADTITPINVTITAAATTPKIIDVDTEFGEATGVKVTSYGTDGKEGTLSVVTDPNHSGFGVKGNTDGHGSDSEIGHGSNGVSEKVVFDFTNDVNSLDVSFAWRNNSETARVTFFNDGQELGYAEVTGGGSGVDANVNYYDLNDNLIKTVKAEGGTDKVDLPYTFEFPDATGNPEGFDKVEFSAPGHDDDYLIHEVSYTEVIDPEVTNVTTSDGKVTFTIQLDYPPEGGSAKAIVEVNDNPYTVDIDATGKGTLSLPAKDFSDLSNVNIEVKEVTGGNYEKVNSASQTFDLSDSFSSTDDVININEDQTYILTVTDFGELGEDVKEFKITDLPEDGTLYLTIKKSEIIVDKEGNTHTVTEDTKVEITEGQILSLANVAAGNLVYVPKEDSDEDVSLKFQIGDGNGNFKNVDYTTEIDIKAVADAPTASINVTRNVNEGDNGSSNSDKNEIKNTDSGDNIGTNSDDKMVVDRELVMNEEIDLKEGNDTLILNKDINQVKIYLGEGDDEVIVNGKINGTNNFYLESGDDVIRINDVVTDNTHVFGGDGKDTLYLSGNQSDYAINWQTNNNGMIEGSITDKVGGGIIQYNQMETIVFGDGTYIGEEPPSQPIPTEETYTVDINAALTDLDGSESLTVTITNVPDNATLTTNNSSYTLTNNHNNTWTVNLPEGAKDVSDSITMTVPKGTENIDLGITARATEANDNIDGDNYAETTDSDAVVYSEDETQTLNFDGASSAAIATNVVITLDVSGSMTSNDEHVNRLALAKEALAKMINEYESQGSVNVKLVTFNDDGHAVNTWMSAKDAISAINNLSSGGKTNYEDAVYETYNNYTEPSADRTVAYFISDGEPTKENNEGCDPCNNIGTDSENGWLDSSYQKGWDNFVDKYVDSLHVIAMGSGIDDTSYLDILAHAGNVETTVVTDPTQLSLSIPSNDITESVSGNILDNVSGGDGAISIASITIEGVEYTKDNFPDSGVKMQSGSKLMFDFSTGNYTFIAVAGNYKVDTVESFKITAADVDGDTTSFDVNINVNVDDKASTPILTMDIGDAQIVEGPLSAELDTSKLPDFPTLSVNGGVDLNKSYYDHSDDDKTLNINNMNAYKIYIEDGDDTVNIQGSAGGKVISLGDGDDTLAVGGSIDGSTIDLGDGNNSLLVVGNTNGATIKTEEGNDNLIVGGNVDGATIKTQEGDDSITVFGNANGATVLMDDGNDSLTVVGSVNNSGATIDMGKGDDTVAIGKDADAATIHMRDGDDTLTIGNDANGATLYTEDGDDILSIGGNADAATIHMGDDSDKLTIDGNARGATIWMDEKYWENDDGNKDNLIIGGNADGATIYMGGGDDTLSIDGKISGSTIYLHSGDDNIYLDSTKAITGSYLNGGDGNDTLHFSGDASEYAIYDIHFNKVSDFSGYSDYSNTYYIYKVDGNGTRQGSAMRVQNIENIMFNSSVVNVRTYQYAITLSALLTDTDGSETLSNITLTDIPTDATLQDSNGSIINANADGSYTVSVDTNGDANVTLVSKTEVDSSDLEHITASVTSTENDSKDAITVHVTTEAKTIEGTEHTNDIKGTDSNEHIDGKGGADTIHAGAGDDTIVFNGTEKSIDGGAGNDTLVMNNDTIDLEEVLKHTEIKNIENIDLTNNHAQEMNINLDDILNITDENHELKIFGDSDDKVTLEGGNASWTNEGTQTIDGETFHVYQGTVGSSNVKVLIDDDVSVTPDV